MDGTCQAGNIGSTNEVGKGKRFVKKITRDAKVPQFCFNYECDAIYVRRYLCMEI